MSHAPLPPPSFAPDFSKGLVPAIAQDAATGEVLMLAYMDENAWNATLRTGEAHYWSRSRQELWHKGGTSGNVQKVQAIRLEAATQRRPARSEREKHTFSAKRQAVWFAAQRVSN